MYPILFSIGTFHVYSFSLLLIVSWMVFSFVFWKLLREDAVPEERIFDLTFYATIAALAGARLLYVALNPSVFSFDILKILALWVFPGLSLWGGIIAGMIVLIFMSRRSGVRLGLVLDTLAYAIPVSFIPGAIGAMLDGAEVGKVASLPWAVRYVGHTGVRHPLGLYEVLFFSILLFVLWLLSRRAKAKGWQYGLLGVWFFLLFSVGMFCLEFVKASPIYFRSLSIGQWIMIGIFGETVGAFYVRGGGREKIRPLLRANKQSIVEKGGALYEKFFKRSA